MSSERSKAGTNPGELFSDSKSMLSLSRIAIGVKEINFYIQHSFYIQNDGAYFQTVNWNLKKSNLIYGRGDQETGGKLLYFDACLMTKSTRFWL